VDEPRKIPTTCRQCGGESFAFEAQLGYKRGPVDDEHPDGRWSRMVRLGGDLCAECGDKRVAAERIAEFRATHARHLEGSFLPAQLRGVDFGGFTQPEAVDLAKRWGNGELQGLCLTGDVGVGKTRLAAAAVWPMLYRRRVRWVDTAQLVSSLRSSFDDAHRAQAMRVITGNGPAVFDDLDKVNPTDFVREVLFGAINARVAQGSPLLITTNQPPSALGEILGAAVMSRLAGYCTVVEMLGADRRVQRPELRAA